MAYPVITVVVSILCGSGAGLNLLLIVLISRYSTKMGTFKYLLMTFSAIELVYALVLAVVQPVFFAYDHRQVTFANSPILPPEYGDMGIGLFCAIYEVWMGFIVVMFLYKYITLCRSNWSFTIKSNLCPKIFVVVFYFAHIVYSIICGFLWCRKNNIPQHIERKLMEECFGNVNATVPGYIVLATIDKDNNFNPSSTLAVLDHYILATLSMNIVLYCGLKIRKNILDMQKEQVAKDHTISLQIFYTLLVQAGVPIILYQIPTGIVVTESLVEKEPILGPVMKFWLILLVIPKVLDPLFTMLIIREYRRPLLRIFAGKQKVSVSDISLSFPHAVNNPQA